jgi:hypothetical protein
MGDQRQEQMRGFFAALRLTSKGTDKDEANAGVLRCAQNDKQKNRQGQKQIPPLRFGMTTKVQAALQEARARR